MSNKNMSIDQLIRDTDALSYMNALKTATAELKEELGTIEENQEYINLAVERVRKILRRIDNQYRALVKCTLTNNNPKEVEIDQGFEELMEGL